MRYKAIWKDTFREIKRSITRFLAILVIIFLGVGFYVGISATSPNMINTADQYFTDQQLMDFRILSTYGLTDENIEELEAVDGVTIQSHYAQDFLLNEAPQSIRLFSYNAENSDQTINQYTVIDGRLPENPGEVALDSFDGFLPEIETGDTISLESGDDGGNPEDHLRSEEFEVVGFVKSPLYIERQSRGMTTIGSGSLGGFGVILEEDYDTDLRTEAYVKIDEADDLQAYSEEYDTVLQAYEAEFEPLLGEMEARRATEIEDEIQGEIDDGWAEIADAERELEDAEAELDDARAELDEGWQEYEDGLAELEEETAAAEREIAANEQQLTQTISDLEMQRADLSNQRSDLESELANLDSAESELNAGREQLGQGINQIDAGLAEIESNRGAIEAGLAAIDAQEAELLATQAQLEQALEQPDLPEPAREELQGQLSEVEAGLATIEAQRQEVSAPLEQEQALLAQRNELQGQLDNLNAQAQELEDGRAQIIDGISQIDAGIAQIDEGIAQANAGYTEIENARETLATEAANAEAELADAEEELNEAEAEYEEGLATFEEERETALEELEDGRNDLLEAEEELADLPEPTYYLFDRSDNIGYMEYKDNADRLSIIAVVFPGFFFLIAIFISFTTMTRMVDEEREYIGIMKALGYRNRHILIKFITYAVFATFAGATLGIVGGYAVIPPLIFNAYSSLYNLPDMVVQQYTLYTVFAFIAASLSTVGASLLAVRHSLKSNAATLLTPKAPKRGSRIWLERLTPIWKRLSFNTKITFRNVFRYKSRMLMTILGIAGSTGLIVTAFGISDSVGDVADIQFGEINQFQAFVALDDGIDQSERDAYTDEIQGMEDIDDSLLIYQENLTARMEGVNSQDVMIYVPEEPGRINDFIRLRDAADENTVHELDNSGAMVTQKLSELFDLEVGDDFEVAREDDEIITVTISEIVENYMGHYLYMTSEYYQEVTGSDADTPNLQFVKFDTVEVEQEELGTVLLNQEAVLGVTYSTVVYDAFADTMGSLDFVTQILVGAAAALAFIVLYNLTNINVAERQRELSTIKVLGSHDYEVTLYIYRENIILTLLGIAVGTVFGQWLTNFIMGTMEIDNVVFGRVVHLDSYLYAVGLTLLFSVIVMIVIHYQLKRIDMVEALKAND